MKDSTLDDTVSSNIISRDTLRRLRDRVPQLMYAIATVCLLGIAAILLFRIWARNLGISVPGLQIIAQVLMIWMVFLVLGNLESERRHIRVNYFVDRLSGRVRRLVNLGIVLASLLTVVLLGVSAAYGLLDAMNSTLPSFNISAAILYAPALIGFIGVVLVYLFKIYRGDF